jgi:hypothetical protein
LYHVNGRETLFTIGVAMIDISHAYYKALLPLKERPNPFRLKLSVSKKILEIYSASYFRVRVARERIHKWSLELKKLCRGTVPTSELLADITAQFPEGYDRVKLPISNRKVYLPQVISEKIMENMRIMVNHEIRTIIALVGDILLEQEGRLRFFVSRILAGRNLHDNLKYSELAAALRVYGTKFVTGKGHYKDYKEEKSQKSCCF